MLLNKLLFSFYSHTFLSHTTFKIMSNPHKNNIKTEKNFFLYIRQTYKQNITTQKISN